MPEDVTLTLEGLAAVIVALGLLVTAVGTAINTRRTGKVLEKATSIETQTNGVAAAHEAERKALSEKIDRQRDEMAEIIADRLVQRLAALEAKAEKGVEPK